MDCVRSKLAQTAVFSRAAVFLLSVAANLVLPDHDAGVFRWTVSPSPGDYLDSESNETMAEFSIVDHGVAFLTDGLARWDGQYFLHVANNGYSYENTLAFFPLYPLSVRATGELIHWLQVEYGFLHISSALRLAGVLLNVACFVGACLALYELSVRVLRDEYMAYRAALLFCCNPASIFFSACYSESLCCFLTFYALLRLERSFSVKTALVFAAATACRSNALINLGFILYKGLRMSMREVAIHRRLKQLGRSELSETLTNVAGDSVMPAVLSCLLAAAPFAAFQWFAFTQFCGLTKPKRDFSLQVLAYASDHGLKLPSAEPSPWCHHTLPMAYSYVQSHYWGVGFLRYFELKQIPNFLLAGPVLFILLSQARKFFQYHRYYSLRLGCTYFAMDPAQKVPSFDMYLTRILPKEAFVYVVHSTALSLFCLFFIHVQVTTRMLCSSSPVLYWLAAILTAPATTAGRRRNPVPPTDSKDKQEEMALKLDSKENLEHWWKSVVTDEPNDSTWAKWTKLYFLTYTVAGTVLFANFLPWT